MATPIPQPKGLPLLGNIFDIDPSNTWASLQKLQEQYGEIFQIKILGKTLVFVASSALAEELCDETRFRKFVGGPIVEIRQAVHDSLFTAYDGEESWGIAHRIIAPRLQPEAIAPYATEMRDVAYELVSKWKSLSSEGNKNHVSAVGELNRLNIEATALSLYGRKLNNITGPPNPMIQAMEDSVSEAMMRPTRPGFLNFLLYRSKFNNGIRAMRKWAADILEDRRKNPTPERKDVLDALMNEKDPKTGQGLEDSRIIDEIVTMPIGSSTAPALLSTAIYFLLKLNPGAIETAREELDTVLGDQPIEYEHLERLPYTLGIVREALRLSFAAPGFNIEPVPERQTDKSPIVLGGGKYQVAHNQPMIVVLAGANRDPAVFEEPNQLRPERMVGDKFNELPKGARRYFGNGKRECIGKHYAWIWSQLTMAILLKEIDFEMVNPHYELKQDGWFNIRPVDFFIKVKPRQK